MWNHIEAKIPSHDPSFTFDNNGHIIKSEIYAREALQLHKPETSIDRSTKILNVRVTEAYDGSLYFGFAIRTNNLEGLLNESEILYCVSTLSHHDYFSIFGETSDLELKSTSSSLITLVYGRQTPNDECKTTINTDKAWIKIFHNGHCLYARYVDGHDDVVPTILLDNWMYVSSTADIEVDYRQCSPHDEGINHLKFSTI